MRLTGRCENLLRFLRAARWLRTRQLHRRFFAPATVDAARERLHTLAEHRYLVKVQATRMQESLFRLGPEGKRYLERAGEESIALERQPPKQLEHFLGINDIRIAAELSGPLDYFFAYWELPGINWKQPIIPDAIFGVSGSAFAVEFDRGQENLQYFLRSKVSVYCQDLDSFPIHRLLIVTGRQARMEALAKTIGPRGARVLLTRLDSIQQNDLNAPIFLGTSLSREVKLL